jgi:hypothetical protein
MVEAYLHETLDRAIMSRNPEVTYLRYVDNLVIMGCDNRKCTQAYDDCQTLLNEAGMSLRQLSRGALDLRETTDDRPNVLGYSISVANGQLKVDIPTDRTRRLRNLVRTALDGNNPVEAVEQVLISFCDNYGCVNSEQIHRLLVGYRTRLDSMKLYGVRMTRIGSRFDQARRRWEGMLTQEYPI